MVQVQGPFEMVDLKSLCMCSHFAVRKPAKEVLDDFQRFASENSKLAKNQCSIFERVQYGENEKQFFDVFYPKNYNPETELFIFYHGGYWQEGSSELYYFFAPPILSVGKVLILMNRVLCPEVRIQTILDQDKDAMVLIAKKFSETHKITLCGHSSGGHEIIMMLSSSWEQKFQEVEDFFRSKLKHLVVLCGVLDVVHLLLSTIDDDLQMSWEEALSVSPLNCLDQLKLNMSNYDCQIYMIHVEYDSPTILKWKTIYENELTQKKIPFKSETLKGFDHFEVLQNMESGFWKIILKET